MGRRAREESDCNVVLDERNLKLLRGGCQGHDYTDGIWRPFLQKLRYFLDNESEGDALVWLDNGTKFRVQQTQEVRLAKRLGLKVCSLHQILEALNFEYQENDPWTYTTYHHDCFAFGSPEKIEQILRPLFSAKKDVVMPSVAYSSALKPLEVRLSFPDTRSQTWEVTVAPSVLPRPAFDVADILCAQDNNSTENSWGDIVDDSGQWSDHDMNSPLWWSQRSDFSSICTDDLSDMDTLSQISAYYA